MKIQTLPDFEQRLRRIIGSGDRVRPFVCEGSPLACRAFLVGANAATELNQPFWHFWTTGQGFDKDRWFEAYKHERANKPLKPGKTRRNPVSNTRKRLDWIVEEASPCRCLETNIYSVPTEELRDLRDSERATAVFDFLIDAIEPSILVFHGKDAKEHAEAHFSVTLRDDTWTDNLVRGRMVRAIAVSHFSRGWSEAAARELGQRIRIRCQ
jgi:hypothetical protein